MKVTSLARRQSPKARKPNGYIIHEDRIRVVIATGFRRKSKNPKTGHMVQIFIIRKDIDPVTANRTGKDKAICGSCPLKGGAGKPRTCYVTLIQAPRAVYVAYKRGSYPVLTDLSVFNGRAVRIGAYGDPVHIPFQIVREIASRASTHTGYTHQWANPLFAGYKALLMASCDTEQGMKLAQDGGWRTFRVVNNLSERTSGEIPCVNESKGVQCVDCGLCSGTATKAKSVCITVHGTGASNFSN